MCIAEISKVGFKRSYTFSSEFRKLHSSLTHKVIFQTSSFSNLNKHSSQHMSSEPCVSVTQNAPDTVKNPLTPDIAPILVPDCVDNGSQLEFSEMDNSSQGSMCLSDQCQDNISQSIHIRQHRLSHTLPLFLTSLVFLSFFFFVL